MLRSKMQSSVARLDATRRTLELRNNIWCPASRTLSRFATRQPYWMAVWRYSVWPAIAAWCRTPLPLYTKASEYVTVASASQKVECSYHEVAAVGVDAELDHKATHH